MAKTIDENKKVIENNLKYVGLDLSKVPKFLTEFETLNYRPMQSYDDIVYKVYRYIDVNDVQILITPTDRLTDLKEKYKLASPIFTYLDEENKENIERFTTFLQMIINMNKERIEELEKEQNIIKDNLPIEIKYENNFVWEIYYSDYAQKYFMLVSTKEQDNSALFYLLKKQISSKKTRKKEKIFVPISNLEYSGEFLSKSEISDVENYLWYFTKNWASVYEVYDQKDKLNIKIVGNANVYEKIKSDYVITLKNKQKAIELYKVLKAMFILATGMPSEYNFNTEISENGELNFLYKGKNISYEILSEFINSEYLEKKERIIKESKEKEKLEKRLKKFNLLIEELTQEYLLKQKQITTFLECKKTFFGRVRYFFKKKENTSTLTKPSKREKNEEDIKEESIETWYKEKEQYTIEDLINICTKLQAKIKENTNLNLDINAIENKKDILSKKIDNADLYIKEIDNHKKSIFEFWKFTSKDEKQTLAEGEALEETNKEKINKFFDYETDIEDLGKIVDEVQRRKLSKNETDAIFAARYALNSIRKLAKNRDDKSENNQEIMEDKGSDNNSNNGNKGIKTIEKDLEKLKKEYKENLEYINMQDFDIFGGLSEDKTKIKTINNEKHRENKKDKYKVLNINLDTPIDVYIDNLQHYVSLICEALNKIKAPYNMSIYKVNNKEYIDGLNIFDINPQKVLESALEKSKEDIILYRINIKQNMPIVFYSNIMLYDNFNKTLPVGMNLSSEVLMDVGKVKLEKINEVKININCIENEFSMVTRNVKILIYDATENIGN